MKVPEKYVMYFAYDKWTRLKKRKTPGTDKLSNEIICLVLDTDIGFAYILELMNLCWTTATLPELWHVARIVAKERPRFLRTTGQ